ncbi:hypothetical protein, variant 1 [Aphanomyces astaci]|uniref:Uncharacterized protein n=1 Tax=Aphanomyces astaci TaxID=112090 RepID=W4FR45_APHAT|nr:hypothetical protein, variant 1 [Aphanomyces astaci]ETV69431.1 hypothetical protein, variant 1 [Aphanomyces astaci]|eukprot:XP_009841004.1 hypothetical protein, variant 1 [Aphanomyces astaci]
MGFDDSCSATTTTTRVLDIQSDWQTTEDDSFWVSSSDRVVLTYPDPIAGAHVLAHGSTPTSMHTVHKADASTAGIPSSTYHIADQSRYSLTVATDSYSMSFFTPHTQTPLQAQLYAVSTSPNGAFLGVGGADGLFHVLQVPTHTSLQLAGHVSDVTHVEFFPSSLVALTGSADFSLRIWSVQTFTCGAVLRGHKGAISGIGILGRGRNVVSCAQDRFVKLWHCGSSHCYRDWHLPSTPRCLVSSASHHDDHDQGRTLAEAPDMEFETSSTWLIVGTDAGVTALDARVASPVLELGHAAAVTACATTHGSAIPMLVTGTEDGVLSTYDLRQPKYVKEMPSCACLVISC